MNPEEEGIKLGKYRHFKGDICEVIGLARHSETLEKLVIYKHLGESEKYGKDAIWVRPLNMFKSKKYVDGKEVQRFEYIKE